MIINLNSWAEIHHATRQLPPVMKIELVRALLSEIQPDATVNTKTAADVLLLTGLSNEELYTLTQMMLPDAQQDLLNQLLHKNHTEQLSTDENREIDELLAEVQRISLIKAKAIYTLQQRSKQNAVSQTKMMRLLTDYVIAHHNLYNSQ